jgi:hypothetical protein
MVCFLSQHFYFESLHDRRVWSGIIRQGLRRYAMGLPDKIVSINAILSDGSQVVLGIDFGSIYRKDKRKQLRKFYLQEIIRRAFWLRQLKKKLKISKARNSPS